MKLSPQGLFVNVNNSVYVADSDMNQVLVWSNGSGSAVRILSDGLINPYGVFVGITGDIYIDNGYPNSRVDKWTLNSGKSVPVMNVSSYCYGIFVDINNTIYCSLRYLHQVVTKSLNNLDEKLIIVAGNGSKGSLPHMLDYPWGIFVDKNFTLYIADSMNGRIQKYLKGKKDGITVAGKGKQTSISEKLNSPTGIIVDADGYLYIADKSHRIIRVGSTTFTCLIGCSRKSGSLSNQLNNPLALSFDSYGNIFVSDSANNRIQLFTLSVSSCGKNIRNRLR